ncbi:MAG: DUF4238 domain-containing protein [Firmicutes bacterium]|nr:DUF4238 domain-containing protein [Bacillota bacterium]
MYCHIVPQVYQKAWHSRFGEANVFYFDKNDLTKPQKKQGGNVEKNMGIKDEYILDSSESIYEIDPSPKAVEDFFSHGMENSWNDVLESNLETWIAEIFSNRDPNVKGSIAIEAKDLEGTPYKRKLHEHIILQYIRVFENFLEIDKMTNGGLVDFIIFVVNEICKTDHPEISISDANLSIIIQDEKYKKSIWKSILVDCQKRPDDNYLSKVYNLLISQGNLTFFWSGNSKVKYILSDRPVIWNAGKVKRYEHLESGIFFPISPTMLVAHLKYRDDTPLNTGDAVCLPANDNFIKYINHILHIQSNKQVGFSDGNILPHISQSPFSQNEWESMFNQL